MLDLTYEERRLLIQLVDREWSTVDKERRGERDFQRQRELLVHQLLIEDIQKKLAADV